MIPHASTHAATSSGGSGHMRVPDDRNTDMFSYLSPAALVRADHPLRVIRLMTDQILPELSPRFTACIRTWVGRRSPARAIAARSPSGGALSAPVSQGQVLRAPAGDLAPSGRRSVVVHDDIAGRAIHPGVEPLRITQRAESLDDLKQHALHQIVHVGLVPDAPADERPQVAGASSSHERLGDSCHRVRDPIASRSRRPDSRRVRPATTVRNTLT